VTADCVQISEIAGGNDVAAAGSGVQIAEGGFAFALLSVLFA
jgi:hypothetical protein